jgi:hypothetical protein
MSKSSRKLLTIAPADLAERFVQVSQHRKKAFAFNECG